MHSWNSYFADCACHKCTWNRMPPAHRDPRFGPLGLPGYAAAPARRVGTPLYLRLPLKIVGLAHLEERCWSVRAEQESRVQVQLLEALRDLCSSTG